MARDLDQERLVRRSPLLPILDGATCTNATRSDLEAALTAARITGRRRERVIEEAEELASTAATRGDWIARQLARRSVLALEQEFRAADRLAGGAGAGADAKEAAASISRSDAELIADRLSETPFHRPDAR